MRKCPVCKAEIINDNAEFCKSCGAKLSPSVSQTKEKNEDVVRPSNGNISLSGKQEVSSSHTCGGVEDQPKNDPNSTPSVHFDEKTKLSSIIKGRVAIFLLALFTGGLTGAASIYNTIGHGGPFESDTDPVFIDTTEVNTTGFVDEIEEISPEEENLSILKDTIAEVNKGFPMKVDKGMVVRKCYLDGDYVMFDYDCDEDVLDMDLMEQNKTEIQEDIKKFFKSVDADFITHMCLIVNKGVGYKFVGDSTGKTVLIRFSCQELESKRSNSKMKRGL